MFIINLINLFYPFCLVVVGIFHRYQVYLFLSLGRNLKEMEQQMMNEMRLRHAELFILCNLVNQNQHQGTFLQIFLFSAHHQVALDISELSHPYHFSTHLYPAYFNQCTPPIPSSSRLLPFQSTLLHNSLPFSPNHHIISCPFTPHFLPDFAS